MGDEARRWDELPQAADVVRAENARMDNERFLKLLNERFKVPDKPEQPVSERKCECYEEHVLLTATVWRAAEHTGTFPHGKIIKCSYCLEREAAAQEAILALQGLTDFLLAHGGSRSAEEALERCEKAGWEVG